MPVYGRFEWEGSPRFGEIIENRVYFLDDLFGSRQRTGESTTRDGLRVLAPVTPSKIVAIGLNYVDHAAESGQEVPQEPLMWLKAPTSIIAHNETIELAYPEHRTDYEAELTVVIGKTCRVASEADALDYVLGYTNGQDISDRKIQRGESQWARAKSMDTYSPMGPFIHADLDPTGLIVESFLNGERKQSNNTSQLVFSVAKLIEFISRDITLLPGDCIMTGTPFGVGPLSAGDVLETRITGVTPLVNTVANRVR
ncbi:MAG TPA: fumarylacetoacetate hydrolase family protein [Abditibacteriaceae bacterium]